MNRCTGTHVVITVIVCCVFHTAFVYYSVAFTCWLLPSLIFLVAMFLPFVMVEVIYLLTFVFTVLLTSSCLPPAKPTSRWTLLM